MANSDLGHKLTDKELAKLERRIAKLYREAGKELQATIDAYFEQFKKRDEEMKALIGTVQNGKEWTEADYKQWRLNQIGRGERYQAMRDKVAHRMTDANAVAVSYTNDATPGIYSLNRNYSAYTIEQVVGNVGFDLWDEQTVKRLIAEQPELMPYYPKGRALKRGIDLAYGKKQITASVTSSILQGKSIKHMADDLQKRITTMSRDSAIRTARTAVTGAQNAGRMDSYAAAEKMGIKLKREWVATLDGRTRHAHAMLDGQRAEIDKPFKIDGYEIMYPGDASAPGYLVYNCRCTLVADVEGVDTSDALRRTRDGLIPDMTYAQWKDFKTASHSSIIKANNSWKVIADPITRATIDSIPKIVPQGFTNEMADRLQEAYQKILTEAMAQEDIQTEVGAVFNMRMERTAEVTVGKRNHISLLPPNEPYISIHSHPDSLIFSAKDLQTFSANLDMQMMSVVGHDGTIYILQRTDDYDGFLFLKDFSEVQKKLKRLAEENKPNEYVSEITSFLERSEKYGTHFDRYRT
jgi:SPP1 gp7 family putative phage head morphogenesis protein|nr:MAG TPA: minor capsid protein [Caudoviricetes sp.]DAJ09708.1 MAG TPA: minor capsid protein [Caudoviricetes sp.]